MESGSKQKRRIISLENLATLLEETKAPPEGPAREARRGLSGQPLAEVGTGGRSDSWPSAREQKAQSGCELKGPKRVTWVRSRAGGGLLRAGCAAGLTSVGTAPGASAAGALFANGVAGAPGPRAERVGARGGKRTPPRGWGRGGGAQVRRTGVEEGAGRPGPGGGREDGGRPEPPGNGCS